jgi:uncharacterized protein YkwD
MHPLHRQSAFCGVLIGAFLALAAAASRADTLSALNLARQAGCAAPGVIPVRRSSRLDAVARRLARGETLHEALLAAMYRVSAAVSVHLVGLSGEQETARALAERHCDEIADARFQEAGIAERGRDLWLVVAAPIHPPSLGQAAMVRQRVLELVNAARTRGSRCGGRRYAAVPPLSLAPLLTAAALEHSQDMAQHDKFEHAGHDGSTPASRVKRAGYQPRTVGENIAAGVETPEDAVAGWLASAGHCTNIMSARYTEMGVAYATNLASSSAIYWTQVFATPR